jgi:hypothetical protein
MAAVASMVVLLMMSVAPTAEQLIDRVLAVVGQEPITLSDVTAALRFGLVSPAADAGDQQQAALNSLIDRQLELIEVNRYLPPEPPATEIDARLAQIRARFDSQAALDAALRETGVSLAQLRAHLRDTIRIESYLGQRFGASSQPTEDDIVRYYRAHESDFSKNGVLQPFEAVRDQVRKRLLEERSATLIRDWIAGLRRRADVTILPK